MDTPLASLFVQPVPVLLSESKCVTKGHTGLMVCNVEPLFFRTFVCLFHPSPCVAAAADVGGGKSKLEVKYTFHG